MKSKHILTLLAIFVILGGLLLVKKLYMGPEVEITEYETLDLSLKVEDVYFVEMQKSGEEEPLRFEKKDNKWFVASKWNAKAKNKLVEDFLQDIEGLKGELRSSSSKIFSDYGISDEEAYSFAFSNKDGKVLEHLLFGIEKPEHGKSFLRKKGSSDVYLVDKDIFSLIGIYAYDNLKETSINANRWIDLSFMEFDVEKIESINVTRFDENKEIVAADVKRIVDEEKNLKQWVTEGGETIFSIDAKKIKEFLNTLNGIRVEKLVDPEGENYDLESPYLKLTLTAQDTSFDVIIGGIADDATGNRYVKIADTLVYIVSKSQLEKINIDTSKFFVDNPLRIDKESIESINITLQDKSVNLGKSLIEKNTDYIDKLKNFSVKNLLFDKGYSQKLVSPASNTCVITKKDGDIVTLEAQKEETGIYIARVSGKQGIFELSQSVFEDIFEKLDELDLEEATSDEVTVNVEEGPKTEEQN